MKQELIPWRRKRPTVAMPRMSYSPFSELHQQMNDLFDSFVEGFGLAPDTALDRANRTWMTAPNVDVSETDDEIRVTADLPGMDEKDIQVTLDQDVLTIKGEKKQEHEEKKRNYHLVERSYGEFYRTIPLPGAVQSEKIKASFKKGVLTVALPKVPESKSTEKKIDVTTG